MTPASSERIPVTLLTGFLGSGKTTVLNYLVRQPELADTLVIINEFGEMALDHILVAHSTDNVIMEMSSGCLCCSIRGDLVKTLRDITWRFSRNGQRQFRRVLIETTGLADPMPILHTLLTHPQIAPKYQVDGIVTTIDLTTASNTFDQHVEALKQAAVADALVLTKADIASDELQAELLARLKRINPAAPRWEARNGVLAPKCVLDLGVFTISNKTPEVESWWHEEAFLEISASSHGHGHSHDHPNRQDHDHNLHHTHKHAHDPIHTHEHAHAHEPHDHDVNRHDDNIRAYCYFVKAAISQPVLKNWLETLKQFCGPHLLRFKAIFNVEGDVRPQVIHGVQHLIYPPTPLPAWPNEDRRSRIVFITYNVAGEDIESILKSLRELPQA